jgi:hypothetical protein
LTIVVPLRKCSVLLATGGAGTGAWLVAGTAAGAVTLAAGRGDVGLVVVDLTEVAGLAAAAGLATGLADGRRPDWASAGAPAKAVQKKREAVSVFIAGREQGRSLVLGIQFIPELMQNYCLSIQTAIA